MKKDDEFLDFEEATSDGCSIIAEIITVLIFIVVLAMACNWANSF